MAHRRETIKKGIGAGLYSRAMKKATTGRLFLWRSRGSKRTCRSGNLTTEGTCSETQGASLKVVQHKNQKCVSAATRKMLARRGASADVSPYQNQEHDYRHAEKWQ